jgi:hypothetical protein
MAEMVDGPLASRLRMTQQPLSSRFAMNWSLIRTGDRDLLVSWDSTRPTTSPS